MSVGLGDVDVVELLDGGLDLVLVGAHVADEDERGLGPRPPNVNNALGFT